MKDLEGMYILIPAYMPSEEMINLVNNLLAIGLAKIIVIDDGSGKDYEQVFANLPLQISQLKHEVNKGKGRAIKTGLEYIANNCHDCLGVITCDADGQHTPADIKKVALEFLVHQNALVLGSRAFDKDVPARSAFGNTVTRTVYYLASHIKLQDTQTGLRAFSFEMLPWLIHLEGERYEYEINMLLEAARNKIPILEITIETVYINNNRASHFKTIRDSVIVYKNIIKFSLSSFICFGIDFATLFIIKWLASSLGDTTSLLVSVVGARVISSFINYHLNKNMVFKRDSKYSMLKYYLLVIAILVVNYSLMHGLYIIAGISLFGAKIITELILFTVSFIVQKKLIFNERKLVN